MTCDVSPNESPDAAPEAREHTTDEQLARDLGDRLGHHRAARGLSVQHVAARTGLPAHVIRGLEDGTEPARYVDICRLAHSLGVSLGDLLDPNDRAVTEHDIMLPSPDFDLVAAGLLGVLVLRNKTNIRARDVVDIYHAADAEVKRPDVGGSAFTHAGGARRTCRATVMAVHVCETLKALPFPVSPGVVIIELGAPPGAQRGGS